MFKSDRMEVSDDEILESDVEFRQLDLDPREDKAADCNLGYAGQVSYDEPEAAVVCGKAEPQDESRQSEETLAPATQLQSSDSGREETRPVEEYLESIEQIDQIAMASRAKAGGKWKKRRRRNPFISFFLSMYSRRPRQRVAEVARQAGRHWGRMSDSQRKLYAEQLHGFQH